MIISAYVKNPEKDNSKRRVLMAWLGVVLVAGAFYAGLAQRTPCWQDNGGYQWRILAGDFQGGDGLARSHPLYIAAGRAVLAVFGEKHFCWAINAFSGLGMAVALGNVVWLGWLTTRKIWPGLLCAAMLAVAHTPWWLSEMAEVYTWQIAIFTAELAVLTLLIRRPGVWLVCCLGLLAGVDLSMHNLALLAYPVYFVVVIWLIFKRRLPIWAVVPGLICWCIGAGPLLAMLAWLFRRTGDLWFVLINGLVGMYGDRVFVTNPTHEYLKVNLVLIAMNFVNILLPLAVVGLCRMKAVCGRFLTFAFCAILIIHLGFFIHYSVPDKFMFILPTMCLMTILATVGLDYLASLGPRWKKLLICLCLLGVVGSPAAYFAAPKLAKRVSPSMAKHRWPYRDELSYWLLPWKCGERSALLYSLEKLETFAPNQKIDMSGKATAMYPMLVTQIVCDKRPDVFITSDKQPGGEFRERIYTPDKTEKGQ